MISFLIGVVEEKRENTLLLITTKLSKGNNALTIFTPPLL